MNRLVDLIISVLFILLLLPLWMILSLLIKMDSTGPIIYKQVRMGKNKREFMIYKFRSMIDNAEQDIGPTLVKNGNLRITKIGNFMRKYHIDETLQLINVIKGDMSLVGPRPERPYFVKKLLKVLPNYELRFNVLPGITGPVQINHVYDHSIEESKNKLKRELDYIQNRSLITNFKILLKTFSVIFKSSGI